MIIPKSHLEGNTIDKILYQVDVEDPNCAPHRFYISAVNHLALMKILTEWYGLGCSTCVKVTPLGLSTEVTIPEIGKVDIFESFIEK